MSDFVQLDAPNIGEREKELLCQAIDSGFVSTLGPFVPKFERSFAKYLSTDRAVSLQSGTAALHMALYELGIGPGDEVIVPALTFIATANPVKYVGATPVLADVAPDTWTIDPAKVEQLITSRTRAIIPVHLYGNPCDMDALMAISDRHGLYVIEDATESLGATYRGKQTGTFGDFGCFSFNGNKTITTGGGGMIVGRDPDRLDHIKFLVNQARDEARGYYHPEIGFNYRMTNIEAALGLAQMERLEEFLALKRKFGTIYQEYLAGISGVRFQKNLPEAESACWLTCLTLDDRNISHLQQVFREKGVPTRMIFMPLCEHPPYRHYVREPTPKADLIAKRGLCLPSSTCNQADDIVSVAKTLSMVLQ